jgi:hypothetical protein
MFCAASCRCSAVQMFSRRASTRPRWCSCGHAAAARPQPVLPSYTTHESAVSVALCAAICRCAALLHQCGQGAHSAVQQVLCTYLILIFADTFMCWCHTPPVPRRRAAVRHQCCQGAVPAASPPAARPQGPGHAQPLRGGWTAADGPGHALLQHQVGLIVWFRFLRLYMI